MRHLWVRGPRWTAAQVVPSLLFPPVDGAALLPRTGVPRPYAMAAVLLAALVPHARPELVAAHDIELRAAAPALRGHVPARRRPIAEGLPPAQRILVPAAARTLRLANGIAEFVSAHLSDSEPATVVFEHAHLADHTDQELIAVLLRRIDAARLTVVVCTPDAGGPLATSLTTHADPTPDDARVEEVRHRPAAVEVPVAAELTGEYYRAGFHHAAAELGRRALESAEPDTETWWQLIHRTAGALSSIEREDEARELFDLARRESCDPVHRATAAYATAMLLVRHHDPAVRDVPAARAWINEAVTITDLLPDRAERAFHLSFDLNGKALVEVRLGRPQAALALVERAIELCDTDLDPGEHPIHRLVLRVNRAHLTAMLGDPVAALTDLDAAIAADPGYPDYYIDRGNLRLRVGRTADAVADYETAMRVGPPFPEAYYNRAEVRFASGDHDGALVDLNRALELDPEFGDAYTNRAGLLVASGEYDRARADVVAGLALRPHDAHLFCVLGQIEVVEGHFDAARTAFDAAIGHDPELAAAWAGRGALAYERGDPAAAVHDLTMAIELGDGAETRFNRAVALRAVGRADDALADLLHARDLAPADEDILAALAEPAGTAN